MAKFTTLTAEQFTAVLNKVVKSQKITDTDIQKLAVSAVSYSIEHNDVQPANRLFDALSKSTRRDSLVAYLERFGQFAWAKADKKFLYFPVKDIKFDADDCMSVMWYDAKREADITSKYDVQEAFDRFMKTCEKMMKDNNVEKANAGLVNFLRKASAEYHAEGFDAGK